MIPSIGSYTAISVLLLKDELICKIFSSGCIVETFKQRLYISHDDIIISLKIHEFVFYHNVGHMFITDGEI